MPHLLVECFEVRPQRCCPQFVEQPRSLSGINRSPRC